MFLRKIIKKIREWRNNHIYYVIADPRDNSVTLSQALFTHIKNNTSDINNTDVFVFRTSDTGHYGFTINPIFNTPTQMTRLQYNTKYKCIGFETLLPTVTRIFYDYAIYDNKPCKLTVTIHKTVNKELPYYMIEQPHKTSKNE